MSTVLNHPEKQVNFRKAFPIGTRRKKFFFVCRQHADQVCVSLWFYGAAIEIFNMKQETLMKMSLAQRKRVLMAKWDRIVDDMRSRLQATC